MDFGDIGSSWPLIVAVVVLLLLQIILRRRRGPETNNVGIVQNLISEMRLNLRLAEVFNHGKPGKKFLNTGWKLYGSKLDFLCLNGAFFMGCWKYDSKIYENKVH